jgi:hypothetical protein
MMGKRGCCGCGMVATLVATADTAELAEADAETMVLQGLIAATTGVSVGVSEAICCCRAQDVGGSGIWGSDGSCAAAGADAVTDAVDDVNCGGGVGFEMQFSACLKNMS